MIQTGVKELITTLFRFHEERRNLFGNPSWVQNEGNFPEGHGI